MYNNFWSDFFVLFIAALVGSIAILPYGLRLAKESTKKKPPKLSQNAIILLSILQNAILFAIAVGVGLIVAHQIGLNPLSTELNQTLPIALFFGVIAGSFLLIADFFFLPYFPEKLLDTTLKTTQLENFTASFYGGINEELFVRLFGLSVVVWLLSKFWNATQITSNFWIANIVMAILFAIGHLPALKSVIGKFTPVMIARSILLNMPIGLVCGWLFWNYGIVSAMIAHFSADIVYHVFGTYVLRWRLAKKK